jgi:hypothetical protein
MIRKAVANGEHFEHRASDPNIPERDYPHPITGLLPLLVVLSVSFLFHDSLQQYALILALLGGCICIMLINFRHFHNMNKAINEGDYRRTNCDRQYGGSGRFRNDGQSITRLCGSS